MLASLSIHRVGLGAEIARLAQGQLPPPFGAGPFHWDVTPGGVGEPKFPGVRVNDVMAEDARASEVGAEQRPPAFGETLAATAQTERQPITDETQHAFAGRRVHDYFLQIANEKLPITDYQ